MARKKSKGSFSVGGCLFPLIIFGFIVYFGIYLTGDQNDLFDRASRLVTGETDIVTEGLDLVESVTEGSGQSDDVAVAIVPNGEAIERLELPTPLDSSAVVHHTYYSLEYAEEFELPRWVAYELTAEELLGTSERKDDFRSDPSIKTGSANHDSYRGSGYDRGHLAPAADMKMNDEAMSESFYMSNMAPQAPGLNRRIWLDLEKLGREWATENDSLYIVTGPVLNKADYPRIGDERVAVPEAFFKAFLDYSGSEAKAIGFILPNEKTDEPLSNFVFSIDFIEETVGLDLYPLLPDTEEEQLEATASFNAW